MPEARPPVALGAAAPDAKQHAADAAVALVAAPPATPPAGLTIWTRFLSDVGWFVLPV